MSKKSNSEKIQALAAKNAASEWIQKAAWREANKNWLDHSFKISLLILNTIRSKGITQAELADKMKVTPQYVNKILRGKENLSLETISKIEEVLGTSLIKVANTEAFYIMRVSSGTGQFNFAVKGRKREPSYIHELSDHPTLKSLFVSANELPSDEPVGEITSCSQ